MDPTQILPILRIVQHFAIGIICAFLGITMKTGSFNKIGSGYKLFYLLAVLLVILSGLGLWWFYKQGTVGSNPSEAKLWNLFTFIKIGLVVIFFTPLISIIFGTTLTNWFRIILTGLMIVMGVLKRKIRESFGGSAKTPVVRSIPTPNVRNPPL